LSTGKKGDFFVNNGLDTIKPDRCKIIACATVMKEMRPLLPPEMRYEILEAGLHINPGDLTPENSNTLN
jgi:hypothetical protein